MIPELQEKVRMLPTRPGCYLFKDSSAKVVYVGKAVNIRSRVRSYFRENAYVTVRTRRLIEAIRDVECIVVESEIEALVLECNLIKKYQPHYNVRLRDDKNYPYLAVTLDEPFPRLLVTRRARQDGRKYFGPYSGTRAIYNTMDLMKRIFPIVSCGKAFDGRPVQKPCLYYHMGQCLAPCAGLADKGEYQQAVRDIISFLEGRPEKVVRDLRRQMGEAAENLQFERAGRLRDQIEAVVEVMARQKVISAKMLDQDVIAVVAEQGGACVQMFYIRSGKLIGQNSFLLEGADEEESPGHAVQEFVKQYYQNAVHVPREVLLPREIEEADIVRSWLSRKRGGKVAITVPVRGDKKRLVEMAAENAAEALNQIRAEMRAKLGSAERALFELAEALDLDAPPRRIECYDISNFQGDHFVGSMVTFTDGEKDKAQYRRFKIRFHENKPDDFAMIREVLTRRLARAKEGDSKFAVLPDLIVVDGGKGQLSSAVAAIRESGFREQGTGDRGQGTGNRGQELVVPTTPVCGLAKRFEVLFAPDRVDPVVLPRTSQALYLVQRIRDEAHRFANAYRATLQVKKQTRSALDLIPGIGPARRRALLRHFGSLERIRGATLEDLAAAPRMNRRTAEAVLEYLRQDR